MISPRPGSAGSNRAYARSRAAVWLFVIALVATRIVWMPAHMAFVDHCATSDERHDHGEQDHCDDGHQHDSSGEHECHTADEHELVLVVQRGGVDLEPAGLAAPDPDLLRLRSIVVARRAVEARSLTAPESPPPRRRLGRAPPA